MVHVDPSVKPCHIIQIKFSCDCDMSEFAWNAEETETHFKSVEPIIDITCSGFFELSQVQLAESNCESLCSATFVVALVASGAVDNAQHVELSKADLLVLYAKKPGWRAFPSVRW